MQHQYYIVREGQSVGPFDMNQLYVQKVTPQTLVWREGLPDWVKAAELPELSDLFFKPAPEKQKPQGNLWFAMINDVQVGPASVEELIRKGLDEQTPVWRAGIPDWVAASSQQEIMDVLKGGFNQQQSAPQANYGGGFQSGYGNNGGYGNNAGYQNGGYRANGLGNRGFGNNGYQDNDYEHKDMMSWAIGVTVLAFLFSCIGVVFGIIAIVNANKANSFYKAGDYATAAQANTTARTNIKVAGVFAAIGLLVNILQIVGVFKLPI